MSDKAAALASLGKAVAEVMNVGISGLADNNKLAVAEALGSGAAVLRLTFFPSEQTFIAELVSTKDPKSDVEIFRVMDGGPSEASH